MRAAFSLMASLAVLVLIVQGASAQAALHEENFAAGPGSYQDTQFFVQTLKYDPYPVNPGSWFDVWVKVQNLGENDAKNASFILLPEYPFSSTDTAAREYGIVPGRKSAYSDSQLNDSSVQINQVVLKFRVKADDSAPEGASMLKVGATTDETLGTRIVFSLPIEIAKTRTDFEVRLSQLGPEGSTLIVTNVGDNAAKAVTLDIVQQGGVTILSGAEPASLGDMTQGDFTVAHMKALPENGAGSMAFKVSYTDTGGVRNTVTKTVPVEVSVVDGIYTQPAASDYYTQWTFAAAGAATGAFLVIIVVLLLQKRGSRKHSG
jgi:hypothetical protein